MIWLRGPRSGSNPYRKAGGQRLTPQIPRGVPFPKKITDVIGTRVCATSGAVSKTNTRYDNHDSTTSGAVLVDVVPVDRGGASIARSSGVASDSLAASGGAINKDRKGKGKKERHGNPQEHAEQPLKELRIGRCFTVKQHDYQHLLNVLEKSFKEKATTDDKSQALDHGAPVSSHVELQRGQARRVKIPPLLLGFLLLPMAP